MNIQIQNTWDNWHLSLNKSQSPVNIISQETLLQIQSLLEINGVNFSELEELSISRIKKLFWKVFTPIILQILQTKSDEELKKFLSPSPVSTEIQEWEIEIEEVFWENMNAGSPQNMIQTETQISDIMQNTAWDISIDISQTLSQEEIPEIVWELQKNIVESQESSLETDIFSWSDREEISPSFEEIPSENTQNSYESEAFLTEMKTPEVTNETPIENYQSSTKISPEIEDFILFDGKHMNLQDIITLLQETEGRVRWFHKFWNQTVKDLIDALKEKFGKNQKINIEKTLGVLDAVKKWETTNFNDFIEDFLTNGNFSKLRNQNTPSSKSASEKSLQIIPPSPPKTETLILEELGKHELFVSNLQFETLQAEIIQQNTSIVFFEKNNIFEVPESRFFLLLAKYKTSHEFWNISLHTIFGKIFFEIRSQKINNFHEMNQRFWEIIEQISLYNKTSHPEENISFQEFFKNTSFQELKNILTPISYHSANINKFEDVQWYNFYDFSGRYFSYFFPKITPRDKKIWKILFQHLFYSWEIHKFWEYEELNAFLHHHLKNIALCESLSGAIKNYTIVYPSEKEASFSEDNGTIVKNKILEQLSWFIQQIETNPQEMINFWIIFWQENGQKTVNLNSIKSPQKNYLFWILALSSLKQINIILWNTDSGQIFSISKAQDILKIFFELLGYSVILEKQEKVKLLNFQDYETYFQKNKNEFINFWIDINENQIDLDKISDLKKTLFAIEWRASIKNLWKILWFHYNISNKNEAKEILKAFFEKIWYKVKSFSNTPVHLEKKIRSLDYFEWFLKTSLDDFINFWIIFDKKIVNLNKIKNTAHYNLFWFTACIWLKNLALTLNLNFTDRILNIWDAQDILKIFFEKIWYDVILEKKEEINLATFEDHKKYFYANQKEFEDFWIVFDKKQAYLNKIKNPDNILFWKRADSSLRKLSNLCGQKRENLVNNITESQKILEIFLKKLWYDVFYEISTKEIQETLWDYEQYLCKNPQEFIDFWIIFWEEKIVLVSKIVWPDGNFLFGKTAKNSLRNLAQLLGLNYSTYVTKKEDAIIILTTFFEKIWYKIVSNIEDTPEKSVKKNAFQTNTTIVKNTSGDGTATQYYPIENLAELLQEDKAYFETHKQEFINMWLILETNENNEITAINFSELKYIWWYHIFGKHFSYSLRDLHIKMWGKDIWFITKESTIISIFKKFFTTLWYKISFKKTQKPTLWKSATDEFEEIRLLHIQEELLEYAEIFCHSKKDFENFGAIFSYSWDKKTVILTHIKSPLLTNLFKRSARFALSKINMILKASWEEDIKTKLQAQKVLTKFFEILWYEVICEETAQVYEKIETDTSNEIIIENHKKYFENNQKEFLAAWIELKSKKFSINIYTNSVEKLFLFWKPLHKSLPRLAKALGFEEISLTTKENVEEIMLKFATTVWYEI